MNQLQICAEEKVDGYSMTESLIRHLRQGILLVEDTYTIQVALKMMLKRLGVKVDSVSNGKEAFEYVRQNQYALILMDISMPVMDGINSTLLIREWENEHEMEPSTILAITNCLNYEEKCLAAGMNDFFEKPMTQEHLKVIIEKWAPALMTSESNASRSSGSK